MITLAIDLYKNNDIDKLNKLFRDYFCLSIVDENRDYIWVSHTYEEQLGWEHDEVKGTNIYNHLHPDEIENLKKNVRIDIETGQIVTTTFRLKHKNGYWIWYEGVAKKEDGHIYTFLRNMDHYLKDLYLMRESNKISKTGIWDYNVVTGEGYYDEILANMYGLSPGEKIHTDQGFVFFTEESAELLRKNWNRLLKEHGSYNLDVQVKPKNGDIFWARAIGTTETIDGKVSRISGVLIDIDEEKKWAKELERQIRVAEQATESRSLFLSTMTHELRTPLNAVAGITKLLMQTNPTVEQLEYLENLKFSTETLINLINDILDYNKLDEGKVDLEKVEFNLQQLCMNIRNSMKSTANSKGIQLKLRYDVDIPETMVGDPNRLSQIIYNLMGNGIKFTAEGMVILDVSLVDSTSDMATVKFEIIDTGIGIKKEDIPKIWENFKQLNTSNSRQEGTGLGLSIVKKILTLMHSEVEVKSELNRGTTFSFEISFERSYQSSYIKSQLEGIVTNVDLTDYSILIAEDNEINQFVAVKFLKGWGMNVVLARDGKQALDHFLDDDNQFDLVLMDLQMPIMDGFESFDKIKETKKYQDRPIPILALTASAMGSTREKVLNHGFDEHITKPFNPERLFESIQSNIFKYRASIASGMGETNLDISKLKSLGLKNEDLAMFIDNSIQSLDNWIHKFIEAIKKRRRKEAISINNHLKTNINFYKLTKLEQLLESFLSKLNYEEEINNKEMTETILEEVLKIKTIIKLFENNEK